MKDVKSPNRYDRIIEDIFLTRYKKADVRVDFGRVDIERTAAKLNITLPKNIGDLVYSFRFRSSLPASIVQCAPPKTDWVIRLVGKAKYAFVASTLSVIIPRSDLTETKVPDATPGIIEKYALSDEQALLAKLRYNRLIDVFTGVTCYSLQSHLRTTVPDMGQVETDELYVGLDRRGAHYVLPVQAKGGRDKQSVVQIEQDMGVCREKFPGLICRPIAAQFMQDDLIALIELENQGLQTRILREKHYRLVPNEQVTVEDLESYRARNDLD